MLSKPLRHAVDVEVISHMPKIGLLEVERREIACRDFAGYGAATGR